RALAAPGPGGGADRRRARAAARRDERRVRRRQAPRAGGTRAVRYFLAASLLALFILAWQGIASLHSVDDLTLASPVETWGALRDDWSLLIDNFGTTLVEV